MLKHHDIYTQCTHCEQIIEGKGLYDESNNDMYIDCNSCNQEMIVWNWYSEEEMQRLSI